MRLGGLYRALSSFHDIVLLTATDGGARFEEITHTPRFTELRFPKDNLWTSAYQTLEETGLSGDLAGLAFALAVGDPNCRLRQRARALALSADFFIHEFPYSEPIFSDGCPCREIYNSHNFEVSLLSSIVRGDGFERAFLKLCRLERNLVIRAHRVFATSDEDAEKFRLFYGAHSNNLGIAPNGFDTKELAAVEKERAIPKGPTGDIHRLFFIGSAHAPNVEAANFLVSIAPKLFDCTVALAGGVCTAIDRDKLPPNVILMGPLDPDSKLRLLSQADLFVNPVVLGSGTSLKALEALGAAVPMVSTPEGVRGLHLESGKHCEIVQRDEFITAVRRLLRDQPTRVRLAAAGLDFVRHKYSWDAIAQKLAADITATLSADPAKDLPIVLALNDYPALRATSGGTARIRNLLGNLDSDVVLVSFGSDSDVVLIAPRLIHVTVPKNAGHRAFEKTVNMDHQVSINDGVASLFAGSNLTMLELVSAFALRAGAVIFEHPYMGALLDAIERVRPDLPIVYSAHNVEATHRASMLLGHRWGTPFTSFIRDLETRVASARV